jgi:putative ABC transport system permease protein
MTFISRWLKGIYIHRPERLLETIAGVSLAIALLASLGTFIASSSAIMTRRAISSVPVDWQVLLSAGADENSFKSAIGDTSSYTALERVGYADVGGFTATTGGTVQTTGPGRVLGISARYRDSFPAEIRQLTGAEQGILVAQQTAANLHVKEGDTVSVERIGLPPVQVKIDGVVDLPYADSLFQAVGVPPGTAPQAPPDNVLLIPDLQWHTLFDAQALVRPDTVQIQYHVRIGHNLPSDPNAAYIETTRLANSLEAKISGAGIVGNNLAACLAGVRADALYARVLFLFLGLPGVILAILLTLAVAASGRRHRVLEQALLRVRGASFGQILKFEAMEAFTVGIAGVLLGIALTYVADKLMASSGMMMDRAALFWTAGAAIAGFVLALGSTMYSAWKQARHFTVAASKALMRHAGKPLWQKIYLDLIVLGIACFEYWRTASTGYQVVLAPEGIPQISVHYEAFIAPLFLWTGGVLLSIRLWENGLDRGHRILSRLLRPIAKNLSRPVVASLRRERILITRGIVLVALALSFAVSTAIFNTTYNVQSRVDAELTNGSDVRISGSTASAPGSKLPELKALPGVAAVQPMMHRFAYVGKDLQDIYGIDPQHIGEATRMSNAYFAGGNAQATISTLANQPDGVLVSEETRSDFQLRQGDQLNLRLQLARDHQYHVVPFRFVGVVREFPTAPNDSFLVANASYLAQKTGTDAREIVLLRADGNAAELSAKARKVVSSLAGVEVTDIGSVQRMISSGLTSVNLHGLTRLELVFAVLLVMGSTGLILALGLTERRRNFAILDALGAKSSQLGAFIWSEGLLILVGGGVVGTLLGFAIAHVLVNVLTGVFDPPPEHLYIPWGYMAALSAAAIVSTVIAILGMKIISRRPVVEELRNL